MGTIVISGASGFVGRALASALVARGDNVLALSRPQSARDSGAIVWDPDSGTIDAARLEGVDAFVHLAGESIAGSRWSAAQKRAIHDSRSRGTALIARTLAGLSRRPRALISASAIGYYGDRGDVELDESSAPGSDFLAEVVRDWEAAAAPAQAAGIRVAHARFGVVLDPSGGALARMLPPFRLGLGGRIGPGTQWMSWVSRADVVAALCFALDRAELAGAYNVTSPEPARNAEFTASLARALKRPAFLPVPAFAARLALGELADSALLASTRVVPTRLTEAGFRFRYPGLDAYFDAALS